MVAGGLRSTANQSPCLFCLDLLVAPKLVSLLFLVFILLSILGTAIPQEALYSEQDFSLWQQENQGLAYLAEVLSLTRLFTSPVYIIVTWLLMLSVGICSVQRLFALLNSESLPFPEAGDLATAAHRRQFNFSQDFVSVCQEVRKNLPGRFWRYAEQSENESVLFVLTSGRAGGWGSLLFHASFLVVLTGVLLSIWTRAEGGIVLTEGQSYSGNAGVYASDATGGRVPAPLPFQITLKDVQRPKTPKHGPRAIVRIKEGAGEISVHSIGNFHALEHRGFTFYLKDQGYSPLLRLQDSQGVVLFDGFIALKTSVSLEKNRFSDTFVTPRGSVRLGMALYPKQGDEPARLLLNVHRPDEPMRTVELFLGETQTAGGLEIAFQGLRFWSSFRVVQDKGIAVIYAGFLLGVVGLCVRVVARHEVFSGSVGATSEGCSVTLTGSVEGGGALFQERFDRYCRQLERSLTQ